MTIRHLQFGALAGLFALCGCHNDMYVQPYKRPLDGSPMFADQSASRPLVEHTVPQESPEEIGPAQTGYQDGKLVAEIPVPVTQELLIRGQERFNIYCSVCHGADGYGQGMIVRRGFPPPPTFHSERLRQAPAGHFFDVMTHGYGVMYPYAARVDVNDRWAITAYIRALQLSQHAPIAALPADVQQSLATEAAK